MSVEDKIRRAEEIYYRRRGMQGVRDSEISSINNEKKDIRLFKKTFYQIIICLMIYSIFYLVVNNNYIFSEDFTNKAREILDTDINFSEVYSIISTKIDEYNKQSNQEEKQEETQNIDQVQPTNEVEQTNTKEVQNNDENIGGAEENINQENVDVQEQQKQEVQPLSQMEQDANTIKSTISFIKPVNGTISSIYGARSPTTPTVPKNHTGTDIAAPVGTKIVSATDGTVIQNSSQGDYGKHLKIQINDVIVVYAHCNDLYVNEGDIIKQGQEIAEVGATGNVTGPHLHFEVRFQDRFVDPQLILEL